MYKKHSSFSFIALLFVPRLSEHERPGAIGMIKAGVQVSGVARYYNCHPSAIQHLRDCYQVTWIGKGGHRPGKLRMATDIKTVNIVDYIDDIYIDDILPDGYQHCRTNSRAPRVICFRFLIRKIITIALNLAKFQDIFKIVALESKGIVF